MITQPRATGITTAQMLRCKYGIVYVWCNGELTYPRALAEYLDRRDLIIESESYLRSAFKRGDRVFVVDHAIDARLITHEHFDWNERYLRSYTACPSPRYEKRMMYRDFV